METARDLQIKKRYRKGQTLRSLGSYYGVTAERVRQILAESGVETRPPGRKPDPLRIKRRPQLLQDRFFNHLEIEGDHWVWKNTVPSGYGTFTLDGILRYAHRVAWYLTKGAWPDRLRKVCDVDGCVNPVCWEEWS